MKKIEKSFLIIAALPLLFIACSEEQVPHGESVEISEYQKRFVYEEWDIDASGQVDENELSQGLFESLDIDGDGFLTNEEWGKAEFYFVGNDYRNFNEWDVNNDGMLEEEEFEIVVDKAGVIESYDINDDGLLAEQELSKGVFDTFDTDDDGLLDEEEYGDWEDYQAY